MKKSIITLLFVLCATWLAAAPLDVSLKAMKVSVDAEGAEQLISADVAAPGEVIEYQATYTNVSGDVLKSLSPELPVPSGLTAILGSDQPKAAAVSLDGRSFVPFETASKNGEELTAGDLRAFRWSVGQLKPSESVTVRIRAIVNR